MVIKSKIWHTVKPRLSIIQSSWKSGKGRNEANINSKRRHLLEVNLSAILSNSILTTLAINTVRIWINPFYNPKLQMLALSIPLRWLLAQRAFAFQNNKIIPDSCRTFSQRHDKIPIQASCLWWNQFQLKGTRQIRWRWEKGGRGDYKRGGSGVE